MIDNFGKNEVIKLLVFKSEPAFNHQLLEPSSCDENQIVQLLLAGHAHTHAFYFYKKNEENNKRKQDSCQLLAFYELAICYC